MATSSSTTSTLTVGETTYRYFPILLGEDATFVRMLPVTLKILYENILRNAARGMNSEPTVKALARWALKPVAGGEVAYFPTRVITTDATGVPVFAELAAMRSAIARGGGDPAAMQPAIPIDLVIDHSIATDHAGSPESLGQNQALEYTRNHERYAFLRWVSQSFERTRVVPPGSGIVHQVNLEHLAHPVWTRDEGGMPLALPDSLVGSDSHTPMINALGVFGWGVGGIEAVSAALGEPVFLAVPEVVGCRLSGSLPPGCSASDAVLRIVQRLRQADVVGKIVEFLGDGAAALSLPDRATIANMAAEYGATMGFFPIDEETLRYLRLSGREIQEVALAEAYSQAQGMWGMDEADRVYSSTVTINLSALKPSAAGPRRPSELRSLDEVPASFLSGYPEAAPRVTGPGLHQARTLQDGDVVIAAITSCTTTSNPTLMVTAGLLARKARQLGLRPKPWVKCSLSPGSRVVSDYLTRSGLLEDLEALGFFVAGYGCMSCGGATGPLSPHVTAAVEDGDLTVAAVQSSNRNFEGRIHPLVKPCYLTSPALTVAYALAGSLMVDLAHEPLNYDVAGAPVRLADLWPASTEVDAVIAACLDPEMFQTNYARMSAGDARWQALEQPTGSPVFEWDPRSTFLRPPPYIEVAAAPVGDIRDSRALLVLGDSVTTDHISPGGRILPDSDAGTYLRDLGVPPREIGGYASRRVNAEVMVRGAFANPRIVNEMADRPGPFSRHEPDGAIDTIYATAQLYRAESVPLIIIAGKEYGTGSSRDWAAKAPRLLGVRAVLAESFERIHRSNLVGMGILPLQFVAGADRQSLRIDGSETFDILGLGHGLALRMSLTGRLRRTDGTQVEFPLLCRIDTVREREWFEAGGVLPFVLARQTAHLGAGRDRPTTLSRPTDPK